MEGNANGVVTLKKKGYNTVVLVLLILFVMIIGGIIYYLLCEDEMVIIKNVGDKSTNSNSNANSIPKSEIVAYCPDCGSPLTKNAVFCVNCGKKIKNKDEDSDSGLDNDEYLEEEVWILILVWIMMNIQKKKMNINN